jgi:hypothetical protein
MPSSLCFFISNKIVPVKNSKANPITVKISGSDTANKVAIFLEKVMSISPERPENTVFADSDFCKLFMLQILLSNKIIVHLEQSIDILRQICTINLR